VSSLVTLLDLAARPTGGEGVKSGPIALAIILLLCIAAYFLFKSMSKHLKRVRDDFPADKAGGSPPGEAAQPQPGSNESPAAPSDRAHQTSAADEDKASPRAEVPPDASQ
jgi:hypothetical protein